jgi:O-antigen/teichoic acid export membrane protein
LDSRETPKKKRFLPVSLNKFSIGVIWNIFSLGILGVGGLLLSLLIIRFQNSDSVGVFNQVYSIYIIVSQIGVGGLQFSVLKHISHNQKDLAICSEITVSALLLTFGLGILISIFTFVLADPIGSWLQSPEVSLGLKFSAPGILFFALNKLLINVINGMDHIKAVASLRSLRTLFLVVSVLVLLILHQSSGILCAAFSIAEIILFPIFIIYITIKLFPLKYTSNIWGWIKPHFSFGMRGMMSGVLIELNTRVDVLMLGYFCSDSIVGIYSFVSILAESYSQIPLAIRTGVDPIVGSMFAEKKIEDINQFAVQIKRKYYPIIFFAGVALILLYPILHHFWINDNQMVTSWITLSIIMVGVIINAAYRPFGGILLQGGNPGFFTVLITILLVTDASLNLFFIPIWGIFGAAAVTCFTYLFEAFLLVMFSRKLFGVML